VTRSAGTVMFEFGMRLGREVRTQLGLQKQVNCYLAALNCLRLIRPEYAWIVQPTSGAVVLMSTSERIAFETLRFRREEELPSGIDRIPDCRSVILCV